MKKPKVVWIALAMLGVAVAQGEDFPIRLNQAGYRPKAPKFCTMKNPPQTTFLIQKGDTDICWHTVGEGTWQPGPGGEVIGDFSHVTALGDYRILCGSTNGVKKFRMPDWRPAMQSYHFQIREGAYDTLERSLFQYMTWQRCGHAKGWAGLCHQDPVPVLDAAGRTVRTIDVRGGYHQSCDLRNWHDGISMSLYCLLRYAEQTKPGWDAGEIADELRWGCDYFLKTLSPEGYVYDAQFAPIGWGPRNYYLAPATLGAQCNVVMLFARAARYFRATDAAYAGKLLSAARRIRTQIETNPFFEKAQSAPEKNLPAGAQPAEKCYPQQYRTSVNGFAERAGAALELYRTTGEAALAAEAKALGTELVKHLVRTGADAGWYVETGGTRAFKDWSYCWRISGYRLPIELWREFREDVWKDAALVVAERLVRDFKAKGMKSGARAAAAGSAAAAIYLRECADLFAKPEFRGWAQRSFDWVLGSNPWNRSYVEGIGQNQWQRPVFGQFYPSTPQIPGGVLHVANGEYDMPAVTLLLWSSATLR